ncbi:MAG: hypothetical protein H6907_17285 [Hyphomicrobiales bacterium]|nr:hypothetical protein [Hyphomicrobiales bacterium]
MTRPTFGAGAVLAAGLLAGLPAAAQGTTWQATVQGLEDNPVTFDFEVAADGAISGQTTTPALDPEQATRFVGRQDGSRMTLRTDIPGIAGEEMEKLSGIDDPKASIDMNKAVGLTLEGDLAGGTVHGTGTYHSFAGPPGVCSILLGGTPELVARIFPPGAERPACAPETRDLTWTAAPAGTPVAATQPPTTQPPATQPPAAQPIVPPPPIQPPAVQPPAVQPPAVQPATVQPATVQPPAVQPPAVQPPPPPAVAAAEPPKPDPPVASGGKTDWQATAGRLRVAGSRVEFLEPYDQTTSYYLAPAAYLGDWRPYGSLTFSKKSSGGRYYAPDQHGADGDVVLHNGAMWARHDIAENHTGHYRTFTVPLSGPEATGAWTLGGGAGSLADVLANVTEFRIRAEYGEGRDRSGLGNVRRALDPMAASAPMAPAPMAPAPMASDAGAGQAPRPAVPVDDRPVAANGATDWAVNLGKVKPAVSWIEHDAPGDGRTSYYIAPPHYHGDWRPYAQLEFDKKSAGGTYAGPDEYGAAGDVVLRNGTLSARHDLPRDHDGDWHTYTVPLATDSWQLGGGAASLDQVLGNVTDFQIRAEYGAGTDSSGLRKVIRRP